MAVDLARYVVSLEAQTAKYVQELDKANRKLDRFHKDQQRALAGIKKAFLSLGVALASALSVAAIVNFTKASIQMADRLGETARAAGVSAETLQRLRFALDQLGGIAAGETDQGLQRFNRTLGLAINGSRQAQQQFRLLGVAFRDSLGRGRETGAALESVLQALGDIRNDAQRAAIAGQLFGREMGPKLAAALKGGSQALDEARRQVTGVISDESVRKAEALDDAFKRMAATIGGPLKQAAIGAAFEIAKLFGHVEDTPADILNEKIADTEASIKRLQRSIEENKKIAGQGGIFGFLAGSGQARERITEFNRELVELQMNLGVFLAAAAKPTANVVEEALAPISDGLEEISTAYGRLPADLIKFDFEGALNAVSFQEIRDVLVKMPADLVKLSPEMNNFIAALNNSVDGMTEMEKKAADVAQSIGRSFEDAFTGWILGVEHDFKDLLKRLAAEFATSAIFGGLSTLFPAGGFFANFFGGGRAEGGPLHPGKWYMAGERGPEPIWGGGAGAFAMASMPGGGSVVINQQNTFNGGDMRQQTAAIAANNARLKQEIKAEINDSRRRGRPV